MTDTDDQPDPAVERDLATLGREPLPDPAPEPVHPPITFASCTNACSRCGAAVPAFANEDGTYPRDIHVEWHTNLRAVMAAVADALDALSLLPTVLARERHAGHHPSMPQRPVRF